MTSTFNDKWQPADAALLQPSHLPISRVQRAWERKPLDPFSRQRLRVAKVWKRRAPSQLHSTSDAPTEEDRASKRRKARASLVGPSRPVKKMCLESTFGMAPRVLQWEGVESPARKIVTRSAGSDEVMLALPDLEEPDMLEGTPEDDGNVTVEILDEHGTLLEVGGEELAKADDWQDEEDAAHLVPEEPSYNTVESTQDIGACRETSERVSAVDNTLRAGVSPESTTSDPRIYSDTIGGAGSAGVEGADNFIARISTGKDLHDASSRFAACSPSSTTLLPAGFVSPMKTLPASRGKLARKVLNSRRATLPMPSVPMAPEGSCLIDHDEITLREAPSGGYSQARVSATSVLQEAVVNDCQIIGAHDNDAEQEWEDVEDDSVVPESKGDRSDDVDVGDPMNNGAVSVVDDTTDLVVTSQVDHAATAPLEMALAEDTQKAVALLRNTDTEAKLPSSPIPSIEGQHPRLPLRRSPRRKSSSPLKQSAILPSTGTSHLVALTPIRGPVKYSLPSIAPSLRTLSPGEDPSTPESKSPIERAASAPPQEPNMSPQKPSKPRVSDDTALLQAFLNRAAESRSSRHVSVTKRESITNRRDSESIRQALTSPGKSDVLADLDPNSPSPRKPLTEFDNTGVFDSVDLGSSSILDQPGDIRDEPSTRRSDRAARRAKSQTPAAPNKIAIRGNTEQTVLQKSEAQQLAVATKNNTRKNKGGAVLPQIKLRKLISQASTTDAEPEADTVGSSDTQPIKKGRNVTWSETLVEFYQGGDLSEANVLSDELSAPGQPEADGTVRPPPPSETPSKPKIRRLKPSSRTATAPGSVPATLTLLPPQETDTLLATEPEAKGQSLPVPPTKRRSRIATPAKGLTSSSLLPPNNLEAAEAAVAVPPEYKAGPKKKTPSSKLPALSATVTSLGLGKENLISSPPKKRTGGPPTAKIFEPKLDFGNKAQLPPHDTASFPGLTSPAKKGKGKGVLFGSTAMPDLGGDKREEIAGLSSPAKKRTRRAGGGP